jgi:hypothetical protein
MLGKWRFAAVIGAMALGASGCVAVSVREQHTQGGIVGVWITKYDKAPFPYHMQVFNADGTMQQANPDAGNATTSDSDGKGIWIAEGGRIRGKWVEIRADRATHAYIGRGEISFDVGVKGNRFEGAAVARFYGPDGKLTDGPIDTPVSGDRVTLP